VVVGLVRPRRIAASCGNCGGLTDSLMRAYDSAESSSCGLTKVIASIMPCSVWSATGINLVFLGAFEKTSRATL
jgi:hypothetical protein